jgi:hypothetical protein
MNRSKVFGGVKDKKNAKRKELVSFDQTGTCPHISKRMKQKPNRQDRLFDFICIMMNLNG